MSPDYHVICTVLSYSWPVLVVAHMYFSISYLLSLLPYFLPSSNPPSPSSSISLLFIVICYFFAIIGMEFLEDKVHQGCCGSVICIMQSHIHLLTSVTLSVWHSFISPPLQNHCAHMIVHCSNASYDVGSYYSAGRNETSVDTFYLLNFDSLYRSYGTWHDLEEISLITFCSTAWFASLNITLPLWLTNPPTFPPSDRNITNTIIKLIPKLRR